jgi:hypothetical protein
MLLWDAFSNISPSKPPPPPVAAKHGAKEKDAAEKAAAAEKAERERQAAEAAAAEAAALAAALEQRLAAEKAAADRVRAARVAAKAMIQAARSALADQPLGLETGAVPARCLSASSSACTSPVAANASFAAALVPHATLTATAAALALHSPAGGRLHGRGGWAPDSADAAPWFAVDMARPRVFTGLVLQGGSGKTDAFVTRFMLQTSFDGEHWSVSRSVALHLLFFKKSLTLVLCCLF